jgi:putative tricarboxylic transport membrane protein
MIDLLQHLQLGFEVSLSLQNIALCLVGVLLGTLVGVLPGIGPATTIALLLPLTFDIPTVGALIMLAGIYYGAQYGGSTTAILVNMPGESSGVVTAIDGHQMAKQGRAGVALSISAIGSFFAGCVATIFIAALAPTLADLGLQFGPMENVALMALGLTAVIVMSKGSLINSFAMILLGLAFGLIGTDIETSQPRFIFGIDELRDGIDFVPMAIGLFGVAEILRTLDAPAQRDVLNRKLTTLRPSRADLEASAWPIVRGTLLGSILGILPGSGTLLASFSAYMLEKRLSRSPERFGHGAIEGVAAPEAANNAASQTSFIPMLTLGIPSGAVTALMIGAMTIHGIAPGPTVMTQRPELFWGVICSMLIGNAMLLVINLPLIGIWVRLLKIPYSRLVPAIILFCCIGAYSLSSSAFDVLILVAFGLFGYALSRLNCDAAPLLLAFIIGPMLEENLRRAMLVSHGRPAMLLERPISLSLFALSAILLLTLVLPSIRKRRDAVFVE